MSRDTADDKSSYVIGNGLVPSGNKPFPKPILTQIYGAIWHHKATNEVKYTPRMRPKVSVFFSFMVVWPLFCQDPLELPNGCPNASKAILEDITRTHPHYTDVIMTTMASQITSLTVVYSTVYSDADQRKHQSSASLAFVWGIHRDRWIPRTKGQLCGKCFHLMTSSRGHYNLTPNRCCLNSLKTSDTYMRQ